MTSVLIAIHLMIVIALIILVLLQRSEGGGLGMGSNSGSFMSARGTASTLSRATAILAGAFFVTSLALAYIAGKSNPTRAPLDAIRPAGSTAPAPAPTGGGILDSLRNQSTPAPAPAQAPKQ
jgi:preprotein translocase subunit SecG